MGACIWCLQTIQKPSEEHLLQCGLGCRAARRDIVCGPCNNSFSTHATGAIDVALVEQFAVVRNALVIWSGRKTPPPTLRNAGQIGGVPFDLAPGLVPVIPRAHRKTDGQTLSLIAPNTQVAAEQAEHLRRQYGDSLQLESATRHAEHPPAVHLPLKIGGAEALRAIAKSMFNFAAVVLDRSVITSSGFDDLRRAVRTGGPLGVGHDYVNEFPPTEKIGSFDHAMHVVADPKVGHVRAYVSLFGRFRFSGVLGNAPDLPELHAVLVQDPIGRTTTRTQTNRVPSEPYDPAVSTDLGGNFSPTAAGMNAAVSAVLRAAQEAAPAAIAKAAAEELEERLARATNDEERAEQLERFARKVAAASVRVPFEESLDPEEFGF